MTAETSQIWIVHRDAAQRAALARLVGARDAARLGSPTDSGFASAPAPRAVVLGLSGDAELELEFAHRHAARLAGCGWILVASERSEHAVRRLFDTVEPQVLVAPHSAGQLRGAIRAAFAASRVRDSLSLRRYRDTLAERFGRWFEDVGVEALLRAMDPKLANVPLIVRGETGTGRRLFARYVHTFGGYAGGGSMPFVEIDCSALHSDTDALDAIAPASGAASATLMLDCAETLEAPLRARIVEWIEYGLPSGVASGTRLRWVASLPASDASRPDDPALLAALAGLSISIPALRERRAAIASFARATSHHWSQAAARRDREFEPAAIEALEQHSWPGNLRELESVIVRALAEYSDDPIGPQHLRIAADGDWEFADELTLEPATSIETVEQPLPIEAARTEAAGTAHSELAAESDLPLVVLGDEDLIDDEIVQLTASEQLEEEVDEYAALSALVPDDRGWQSLLGSVSGELRDALGRIRTLAEMIPEHDTDPGFRARVSELIGADIRGVDGILERLDALGRPDHPELEPVDVTDLLDSVLGELRSEVVRRNLVVLKELDRQRPLAMVNPVELQLALRGLLENLVLRSDDDGDLYVASSHNPNGLNGQPALRILVRHLPGRATPAPVSPVLRLELTLCEKVSEAAGGAFTLSEGTGGELVVVLDLPAPL